MTYELLENICFDIFSLLIVHFPCKITDVCSDSEERNQAGIYMFFHFPPVVLQV